MNDQTQEAETAYRNYIRDYPALALRSLRDHQPLDLDPLGIWAFPLLVFSGGELQAQIGLVARDMFYASFRNRYETYLAAGWSGRAELHTVEAASIAPGLVALESRGARYGAGDAQIEHWDAAYLMRRKAAGWRIIALSDVKRPRPAASDWISWLSHLRD